MLNYLWAGMIIIGILYGAFTGKMPDITNAALDSAKEAVTLCITMVGVMAFWMGIMEIASRAGIIEMASKKMRPLIRFLVSDHEYLFAAVDPDQCDRLPESVWKCESGGNCRCGDCGDNGEYAGRDGVL